MIGRADLICSYTEAVVRACYGTTTFDLNMTVGRMLDLSKLRFLTNESIAAMYMREFPYQCSRWLHDNELKLNEDGKLESTNGEVATYTQHGTVVQKYVNGELHSQTFYGSDEGCWRDDNNRIIDDPVMTITGDHKFVQPVDQNAVVEYLHVTGKVVYKFRGCEREYCSFVQDPDTEHADDSLTIHHAVKPMLVEEQEEQA